MDVCLHLSVVTISTELCDEAACGDEPYTVYLAASELERELSGHAIAEIVHVKLDWGRHGGQSWRERGRCTMQFKAGRGLPSRCRNCKAETRKRT